MDYGQYNNWNDINNGNTNQIMTDSLINAINVASFAIGLQNLKENREQSAYNDIHASNQRQAEYLLNEINRRFDEQNKLLDEITKRLEVIENAME